MHSGADGSVTGNITAAGGTRNYAGYTTAVTFDLNDGAGNTTGIGGPWTGITSVAGSSNNDTIQGTGKTYNLTGADQGNSGTVSWTSFENLHDTGAGIFNMHSGADGSVTGNISATGGTLNYVGYTTAVTFDLSDGAGNTTGIGGTWAGITTVTGSSNSDTVTGTGRTYNLTGANAGNSGGISWTSFENLDDAGAGIFNMHSGANGSVTGSITASGGTLNYAGYTTAVTFNLSGGASTGLGGWSGITSLVGTDSGATANTTIVGDNSVGGDQFTITAANGGHVTYNTGGSSLNFTDVGNLTGGTGDDSFTVATGGSLTGAVDGGTGTNTLSYSGNTGVITVSVAAGGAPVPVGRWLQQHREPDRQRRYGRQQLHPGR